jgi:ligand-binding sensor domain-containing protein
VFRRSDGLSGDVILSLFEDREGNVWVASTGGLDRFRELPVTTISVRQGLSSDATHAVLAATDGSIWVGASDALTRLKDGHDRALACRMRRSLSMKTIARESGCLRVRGLRISPTAGSLASKACLAK